MSQEPTPQPKTPADATFKFPFPDLTSSGLRSAVEYATDFWQRSMIFLDILRRSGNQQEEMTSKPINAVLRFDYEVIMKGRDLPRPVNYGLVRVVPPPGTVIDNTKRPVVVIDPRAGQGPGIGGFKPISEIGQAFKAGHPVYFIGFTVEPVEGQTIEDVAHAHTVYLAKVIDLHPDADGKPFLIGNCQAGWHAIMAACMRPDLVGPILVAGAPLSYWAGTRGENPMRYTGGLVGGTWMARMLSDLAGGTFDGAWLISNFDSLNPANTYWTKPYTVWAAPEKEENRYLGFEKWWGAFVHLRGDELQYMVDNLFVGNKLSTAQLVTQSGIRLDMRNIKSPIVCFCSKKDNITPPAQALDWILDNYDSVDEIRMHGQTIFYCLHPTAGHLAIFVGTKVAAKEHGEFINYMDLMDCISPGLYEIVISDRSEDEVGVELLAGDFHVRIEARDLSDIRALGCNTPDDEREFDAVARVSAINNSLYSTFVQPWLRMIVTPQLAAMVRAMQPLRVSYAMCSDQNPFMRCIAPAAESARAERKTIANENPFLKLQEQVSEMTKQSLEALGRFRDMAVENIFHSVYGSPWLQAWLGVPRGDVRPRPKPGSPPEYHAALLAAIDRHRRTMDQGGGFEAALRSLIYVLRGQESVDARSYQVLRRELESHPELTLARFKAAARDQWAKLSIDPSAAIAALPHMLPTDADARRKLLDEIRTVATAAGELEGEALRRLREIEEIFGASAAADAPGKEPGRRARGVARPAQRPA